MDFVCVQFGSRHFHVVSVCVCIGAMYLISCQNSCIPSCSVSGVGVFSAFCAGVFPGAVCVLSGWQVCVRFGAFGFVVAVFASWLSRSGVFVYDFS